MFCWYIAIEVHIYRRRCTSETRIYLRPETWIAIQQVCQLWRRIVLETQVLSTYILVAQPSRVQDLLARSGGLPLSILPFFDAPTPLSFDILNAYALVLEQFRRVSHAVLVITDSGIFSLLGRKLNPPLDASSLTSLYIDFTRYQFHDPSSTPSAVFPGSQFPKLAEFMCRGGHIDMYRHMIAPSLRRLTLTDLIQSKSVSLENLTACLAGTPHLEELVLIYAPAYYGGIRPELRHHLPVSSTRLPKLRLLDCQLVRLAPTMNLLLSLAYPAETVHKLRFAAHDVPQFIQFLAEAERAHRPLVAEGQVHCASVRSPRPGQYNKDIEIKFWKTTPELSVYDAYGSDSNNSEERPHLELGLVGETWDEKAAVSDVLRAVGAASTIDTLFVDGFSLCVMEYNEGLLNDVNELVLFAIADLFFAQFSDSLRCLFSSKDTVPFPQLKVIHLDLSEVSHPRMCLGALVSEVLGPRFEKGYFLEEICATLAPSDAAQGEWEEFVMLSSEFAVKFSSRESWRD